MVFSVDPSVRPGDFAIIGDPVAHSLSPAMHAAALAELWRREKRDGPCPRYHRFRVTVENLKAALDSVASMGLRGINITVPHKETALALIRDVETTARRFGAINTVLFEPGRARAFNTDVYGFLEALKKQPGWIVKGRAALVLGTGGTGRVLSRALVDEGARVTLWNRSRDKAGVLSRELGGNTTAVENAEAVTEAALNADLIVNATAVGLNEGDGLPAPGLVFRSEQIAFDVVYHRETEFLRRARAAGARAMGGLGMLLHQGARSFEIWTGAPAPVDVMKGALIRQLEQKGLTSTWLFDI